MIKTNELHENLDDFLLKRITGFCKLIVLQGCGNCEKFKDTNSEDIKTMNCICKYDSVIKKLVEVVNILDKNKHTNCD
ncbi:MAG: hypothetical protein ACM3O3_12490 [Syntrophothermus sp.]